MTADTLGDHPVTLIHISQQSFGSLVEQYERELRVHCYRMLGTLHDAEDMVQETFLRAWKRRETFTENISLRAWLYKIATNACLDALKKQRRRVIPVTLGDSASADAPIPPSVTDPIWLDPYPDELLPFGDATPEQQVIAREHIRIAFVAALHVLPPRQRAVFLLSDVLDWHLSEIAALLETTVSAVKSALHRARVSIEAYRAEGMTASPDDPTLQKKLDAYVCAWESADVDGLIALLRDDATFSMPPIPSWYRGVDEIRRLVAKTIFSGAAAGRWRLIPTRANGQIAFGLYRAADTGGYAAYGIQVVTVTGGAITDILTFRVPALMPHFNLPASLG